MKIQVLGSGCSSCAKMHQVVVKVVFELGMNEQVEYISGAEGTQKIIELGAMSSPVLAINDQVVLTGFTSDVKKIIACIQEFAETK